MPHDPGPAFRSLHRRGRPFILANAWDIGTARLLAGLGAQAIGTSSAAHAFTCGLPDGGHIGRDDMLAHAQSLVSATALPVSGDCGNGFADAPDEVARTVRLAFEAGLAGISIEDVVAPSMDSYPFDLSVERIAAAAAAARALPRDFVLVARADGVMNGVYDFAEGLRRIRAFDAAGADCLYMPAPPDFESLRRICAATAKPVNALASGHFAAFSQAEFAAIGVARISLGSALARVTHRTIHDSALAIFSQGDFSPLRQSIGGKIIDQLVAAGARLS